MSLQRWSLAANSMVHSSVPRVSVLVAEKVSVYLEGLRLLLERSGFEVIGVATDADQVLALTRDLAPQVLVLDESIPGTAMSSTLDALGSLPKPPRVLLLADAADLNLATQAIVNGAHGVFSKDEDDAALLPKAVRCLSRGQYWVGRESLADVVDFARRENTQPVERRRNAKFGLTRRKLEIVNAIAKGQSNRQIAATLGLSEQTIKHHLSSVFEKTGVSNRLQLALFSIANRLTHRNGDDGPVAERRRRPAGPQAERAPRAESEPRQRAAGKRRSLR